MSEQVSYELTSVGTPSEPPLSGQTDESGTAEFAELPAGIYHLDLVDGSWCLAQSDNVRSDGDLNVVEGESTNV